MYSNSKEYNLDKQATSYDDCFNTLRLSARHDEFVKLQLNVVVVLLLYKRRKTRIAYNAVLLKKIYIWIPSCVTNLLIAG
jgi:hypothetical protein